VVDYTKLAATAKRLIEASGRLVTLYDASSTDADASKPWSAPVPASPDDTDTAIAVFVPVGGGGLGHTLRDRAAQLDKILTQECMIATSSSNAEDLRNADSIADGNRSWKIVVRQELAPGDTSLVWVFGLES